MGLVSRVDGDCEDCCEKGERVLVFVVLDNPVNKVRIVSDGWGLFLEGVAMEANVFLVFVVLDNPVNKIWIVSDGRGLFLEGVAREANVFLVFVVLDNPGNNVMIILYLSDLFIWHIDFYLSSLF